MTECRSPELQDLLPDYAAELLDEAETARVHTHLVECVACAEDVAILRVARRLRPSAAAPDVARIVAALPAPPRRIDPTTTRELRLVRDSTPSGDGRPPVAAGGAARPRPWTGGLVWRVAATLGVVIAGAASVLVARQGLVGPSPGAGQQSTALVIDSRSLAAATENQVEAESVALAPAKVPVSARTVSVSYGDLGDYTEDELERMIDRLDQWDGATSTEPLTSTPIVSPQGGML